MGKRAVKTGRILGSGVCSCKRRAGPLGRTVPTLLEGGDKNTLGTLHESSPYSVPNAMHGGHGGPAGIRRLTFMEHIFWRRRMLDK